MKTEVLRGVFLGEGAADVNTERKSAQIPPNHMSNPWCLKLTVWNYQSRAGLATWSRSSEMSSRNIHRLIRRDLRR
jgi:hypothetical protein